MSVCRAGGGGGEGDRPPHFSELGGLRAEISLPRHGGLRNSMVLPESPAEMYRGPCWSTALLHPISLCCVPPGSPCGTAAGGPQHVPGLRLTAWDPQLLQQGLASLGHSLGW